MGAVERSRAGHGMFQATSAPPSFASETKRNPTCGSAAMKSAALASCAALSTSSCKHDGIGRSSVDTSRRLEPAHPKCLGSANCSWSPNLAPLHPAGSCLAHLRGLRAAIGDVFGHRQAKQAGVLGNYAHAPPEPGRVQLPAAWDGGGLSCGGCCKAATGIATCTCKVSCAASEGGRQQPRMRASNKRAKMVPSHARLRSVPSRSTAPAVGSYSR